MTDGLSNTVALSEWLLVDNPTSDQRRLTTVSPLGTPHVYEAFISACLSPNIDKLPGDPIRCHS